MVVICGYERRYNIVVMKSSSMKILWNKIWFGCCTVTMNMSGV